MHTQHWSVLLLAALCVSACSSGGSDNKADGGTSNQRSSGSTGGGTTAGPALRGQISIGIDRGVAIGSAIFEAGPAPSTVCQVNAIGPCQVRVCRDTHPDGGDESGPAVTAGTITISGGSKPMTLAISETSGLYQSTTTDVTIAPGATATVSASGGDVPPFSGASVTITENIHVSGDYSTIDFSHDLTVQWSGATRGDVLVELIMENDQALESIACRFDAATGAGTIPKAVFPVPSPCASDADSVCTFSISTIASTQFIAGKFEITFDARGERKAGFFSNP